MTELVYTLELHGDIHKHYRAPIPTERMKGIRAAFRYENTGTAWTTIIWKEDGQLYGQLIVEPDVFRPEIGEKATLIPDELTDCQITITGSLQRNFDT